MEADAVVMRHVGEPDTIAVCLLGVQRDRYRGKGGSRAYTTTRGVFSCGCRCKNSECVWMAARSIVSLD